MLESMKKNTKSPHFHGNVLMSQLRLRLPRPLQLRSGLQSTQ
jgi:hypothetical protein